MIEGSARSLPARIGIVALNLLAPGLGLLRVQRGRAAALFLVAPLVLLLIVLGAQWLLPTLGLVGWATLTGATLLVFVAIYAVPFVQSWRSSAIRLSAGPWWSRWYGIAGIAVAVWAVHWPMPDLFQPIYKTFYLPAESMAPTLLKNDRLVAELRGPGRLQRGDIIMLRVGEAIYVKRVAALPGDRIEMVEGIVFLNSRPVAQRLLGIDSVRPNSFGGEARRLSEQFPGEARPHEIYDAGYSQGDDFAEQLVRPGHVFVLGDNRDHSADSRFPHEEMGVEQLPIEDIVGKALFYLWGPSDRMGQRLNG